MGSIVSGIEGSNRLQNHNGPELTCSAMSAAANRTGLFKPAGSFSEIAGGDAFAAAESH